MKKETAERFPARGALVVALVLGSLGLVGCGGSGPSSSSGGTAGAESTTPAAESTATTAASEAPAGEAGGSDGGKLTPAGTELELGQSATVGWVPPGSFEPSKAQSGIELEVAVTAIEEGSTGDLKNIELESSEQGAVPFYVHLELTAPTGQATPAEEDAALSFTAIDDRGQEQGSVTFLGEFPICEEAQPPKPFSDGATYETCLTYLMQGGGSIEKVEWDSGPAKADENTPYFEHPIVWSGGKS
jgi:hypothetical protein